MLYVTGATYQYILPSECLIENRWQLSVPSIHLAPPWVQCMEFQLILDLRMEALGGAVINPCKRRRPDSALTRHRSKHSVSLNSLDLDISSEVPE
jgi:hypothetical protein